MKRKFAPHVERGTPRARRAVARPPAQRDAKSGAVPFRPPQFDANQAVLRSFGIRAKLNMSQPDDPEEVEADRVADAFVRGQTVHRQCAGCGDDQTLMRKAADGTHRPATRTRAIAGLTNDSGLSLPAATRAPYERFFRTDLSHVRVHENRAAADAARTLNARAFVVGTDMYFDHGQLEPGSADGQRLLAHELAHTMQPIRSGHISLKVPVDAADPTEGADPNDYDYEPKPRPGDRDPVDNINDPPSEAERDDALTKIRKLNRHLWTGPLDEYEIESLWNSFGKGLPDIAQANLDEWNLSIENGAELWDILSIQYINRDFLVAVAGKANSYLAENRKLAEEEKDKMGGAVEAVPTEAQTAEIRARRQAAQHIRDAQRAMAGLRMMRVGYDRVMGRLALFDSACHPIANEPGNRNLATKPFNPQAPPHLDPRGDECVRMPDWNSTKAMWDRLQAVVEGETRRYPALYALSRSLDETDVATEEGGPEADLAARQKMFEALDKLLENIDKTEPEVGGLAIKMYPIHQQLFAQAPWNAGFKTLAAHQLVDEYQNAEFWSSLGLGGLSAALFIVASLASGGLAIVLFGAAAGVSGGIAINSWDEYLKLRAASETNLSDTTALVTSGQANAALFTAVLDTVFAFLDVYAAARGVGKAAGPAISRGVRSAESAAPRTVAEATEAEAKAVTETVKEIGSREGEQLAEKLRKGAAAPVIDEALKKEGYVMEVAIEAEGKRHVYRQLRDGRWCRFGSKVCGFEFPGNIATLAESARRAFENPAGAIAVREVAESTAHNAPKLLDPAAVAAATAKLTGRFPVLVSLLGNPGAIERIVRAAFAAAEGGGLRRAVRNGQAAARGQLLEEIAAARVRQMITNPAGREALGLGHVTEQLVFIEGHRITDAGGAKLTDGIIAIQRGDRLEIVSVIEAKAGQFAAEGLAEGIGGLSRASTSEIIQALFQGGGGTQSALSRIAGLDPGLHKIIMDTRGANLAALQATYRTIRPQLIKALEKLSANELAQVRKALSTTEGQIARDVERLVTGAKREVPLFIDGKPITGWLPKRPSFVGAVPTDVATNAVEQTLKTEGFDFRRLDLGTAGMSKDQLNDLAKALVNALGEDLQRAAGAASGPAPTP
jgi:hypothetical protein